MIINRAYKFRLYPNNKQKDIIHKTCSQICSRCGYKYKIVLDLSVRQYECCNCHSYLDKIIMQQRI